ncbi:MAG: Ig-like domain-containing protein, partial [Anaerolineae bacterium]
MRKRIARIIILFIVLPLILVACGRGKEEDATPLPTIVPTAVIPEGAATATTRPADSGSTATEPDDGIAAIDPALIDWPPQVVYSSPAPGEEVLLDGAITIRFDQPMDRSSVEMAFRIETGDGRSAVDGAFSWPRADTLLFTPSQLQRRQTYKISIGETAVAANGLPLELPVELALQTVGFLEVSQVIPANNSQEILPDSAITVFFNRPVVPLVATGQQSGLPDPLRFNPPVDGVGEWVSTSIYRFTPDAPLAGATTYQIQVDPDLADITGAVLERSVSWRFTTVQPEVISITPENGAESVPLDGEITITFNMPMDRGSAETAVSVRSLGEAPGPTFAYGWSAGDRVLMLKPQEPFALEAGYQIDVGTSARSANGSSSLAQSVSGSFRTVRFPAVIGTNPANGQLADQWQRGFTIRFASPMDPETIENRLAINPQPAGSVRYFYNAFSYELSVDFNLELNTRYVVSVPGSAADPYGNQIDERYTFTFTTPGRRPIASFNLPAGIAQLSTSFESQVELIAVNVSSVNVALYEVGLPVGLLNRPFDLQEYRPAAAPLRSWSGPLEAERDVVELLPFSLADGGTLATGVYLLTVDAPETSEEVRYWQNQRQLLVVADTNIVVKEMFGEVHVWVTDLRTGEPASGRSLTLYNEQGVQAGTAVSDNNGFATFPYKSLNNYLSGVTVVSNAPGAAGFGIGSSGWNAGVSPWQFGIPVSSGAAEDSFAYIYTDRPIYRPGDTVYFKGIVRDAHVGRYALPDPQSLELNLYLVNNFGEEGLNETLTVDVAFDGSFHGEFSLPEGVSLGRYELAIPGFNYETTRNFSVAEYRRPEFLVSLTPAEPELLRGEAVDVVLAANYFFGGPAADLSVNWSIYEESYRLAVPGPYLEFGDRGGFHFVDAGPFGGGFGEFGNYISNGEGRTDENGRLVITLPADLLKDAEAGSRSVRIEANVNDLSNFPVASRANVVFHAAETYVGVSPADAILRAGNEGQLDVKTVDWDGSPVGNLPVEVVFYRREWEPVRAVD